MVKFINIFYFLLLIVIIATIAESRSSKSSFRGSNSKLSGKKSSGFVGGVIGGVIGGSIAKNITPKPFAGMKFTTKKRTTFKTTTASPGIAVPQCDAFCNSTPEQQHSCCQSHGYQTQLHCNNGLMYCK